MSDSISRQDAIDVLYSIDEYNPRSVKAIRNLPSADRPKGHIVTNRNGTFYPTVWAECSECGKPIDAWDKFCRHCGAKMEEEHE